jgi:hypothetical protein
MNSRAGSVQGFADSELASVELIQPWGSARTAWDACFRVSRNSETTSCNARTPPNEPRRTGFEASATRQDAVAFGEELLGGNSMVVSLRLWSRTVSATFTSMEPLMERSKGEDRDDG